MSGREPLFAALVLGAAERWESGPLYRLHYWLGLPWRCRIRGHEQIVQEWRDRDGYLQEPPWFECARCKNWLGHA